MERSARLFNCAHCHRQVIICSCCDRNNIYCCAECSRIARHQTLLYAGRRYQNSKIGRHKHADRQRRYRQRINKVTHHTSPALPNNDLLSLWTNEQKSKPEESVTGIIRCHFCGKCSAPFLRSGFLYRQTRREARLSDYFSAHWPNGP